MSGLDLFYASLTLLSGMGVFLYGMKLMGDSLESAAGNKIKKLFNRITNDKFSGVLAGVGIGTAATALVQSSTAVTVTAVSFVNSGIMTLQQAAAVIYGSNIGTCVTALIVALGYTGSAQIQMSVIFAALAGVGAFMLKVSKSRFTKSFAPIIIGLGMTFAGLSIMEDSMSALGNSEKLSNMLATLTNPILLVLLSTVLTALIQSSSAITGIVITLTGVGLMTFEQGMYIIYGSNIGTCITALIASIGTNVNARRVGILHFIFNVLGVAVFMLLGIFIPFEKFFVNSFSTPQMQIAMLHVLFNVASVILVLPVNKWMVKLAILLVPESKNKKVSNEPHLMFLEDNLLGTPPLAVAQLKKEIINMAGIAKANFDLGISAVLNNSLADKPIMEKNEKILNFLNREIPKYLVSLSRADLSHEDSVMLGTAYHTVSDLERVGDYAENFLEYAERMDTDDLSFSDEAKNDVVVMRDAIDKLFAAALEVYSTGTLTKISEVDTQENIVDELKEEMFTKHIERLNKGVCSPETGAIYLSLAGNAERVADHMTNMAYAVKSLAKTARPAAAAKITAGAAKN